MPLLTRKKNTSEEAQLGTVLKKPTNPARVRGRQAQQPAQPAGAPAESAKILANPAVLIAPRISEKASLGAENRVYTFTVGRTATKTDVAQAIRSFYGVTPRAVHVSMIPRKKKFVRGKRGNTALGKKAYVYLKKGDSIESL